MQPEWGQASPVQDGPRPVPSHPDGQLARNRVSIDGAERPVPDISVVGDRQRAGRRRRIPFSLQLKAALVGADLVATVCGLAIATGVTTWAGWTDPGAERLLPTALVSLPMWPILYAHQGLYQARRISRRLEEARRIVNSVLAGMLVLAGISVLLQEELSRSWLVVVAICLTATMVLERELVRRVIYEFRSRGVMTRRVVIVGRNEEASDLAAALGEHRELGYQVVGFVADVPVGPVIDLRAGHDLGPYLGRTTEVLDLVRATRATGVIVATTGIDQESANRLIRDLTREGLFVELTSAMRDISSSRISVRPLGPYPVMCVEPVAQFSWRRIAKRIFDVVVASVGLVLVSPILLVSAIAIRVTSGKGVIFRQQRVGKDGVPFELYKLRTMVHDAEERLAELQAMNEAAGPMFKMKDDPRVTRVGRFLRATSIDELPQLFNVIRGEMSLVGPRPALPNEADQWDDALWERLRVQPGITGMWQVSGRYTASLETYARLDLYYVDNWSLVTDLAILVRTVGVVLKRHGGA
jgi:exopolysaccharide biosynthesis polyprenyl glycosylphosphotransferase